MKKKLHQITALLLFLMLTTTAISQQIIFKNDINGNNPSQFNPYTTGQITDPNVTASGIGFGSGLIATAGNDGYFIREWNTASADPQGYFEFTITPNSGFALNFTNLTFKTGFSGAPNNTPFVIKSSLSNFATNIPFTKENVFAPVIVNFSAATYQNITTAITFRIYPFGSTHTSDTFTIYEFSFSGAVNPVLSTVGFENSEFYVYPNPVVDELVLKSTVFMKQIHVFNTFGQEIFFKKTNVTETKVDCSKMASGIYFVQIDSDKKSKTFKFIKK